MVTAIVLNPNPNIELLATSYLDGDMVLLDPFNDQQLKCFRANCHTLAASPDGRLLAGGGGGVVHIYEFDTLRLLYRIKSLNIYIKQLAFSADSLHLCDIRGSHCNVWEPADLLRGSVSHDSSESTSTSVVEILTPETKIRICAMQLHPKAEMIFCGKVDGSVALYDFKTGAEMRTLYCHKCLVRAITWWNKSDTIMTVDASNGIIAWSLKKLPRGGWVTETLLFQSRLHCENSIIQLLPGEEANKFILSTRHSDHLWSINGRQQDAKTYPERPEVRKWVHHHQSEQHMVCIGQAVAHICSWKDWSEIFSVNLAADSSRLELKSVIPFMSILRPCFLLEMSELDGPTNTRALYLFGALPLTVENSTTSEVVSEVRPSQKDSKEAISVVVDVSTLILSPQLTMLAPCIAHILGHRDAKQLIFLDTKSWVCSVDLENLSCGTTTYSRHFFVPYEWFAGTRDLVGAVIQRDVIFARNDEVAIIRGGLQYAEIVNMEISVNPEKVT